MAQPLSFSNPMDLTKGLSHYDIQRALQFSWTPYGHKTAIISEEALGRVPPIVVFNGPPLCGKDALCMELQRPSYAFKTSLYEATAAFYSLDLTMFIRLCTDRETKDFPTACCGWNTHTDRYNTPREALQIVSELVCKPKFGKGVFGRALAAQIIRDMNSGYLNDDHDFLTVSDGGFLEESDSLCQTLKDTGGKVNMLKLEVHVDGLDFSGDTRSYWPIENAQNLITRAVYYRSKDVPLRESYMAVQNIINGYLDAIRLTQ